MITLLSSILKEAVQHGRERMFVRATPAGDKLAF